MIEYAKQRLILDLNFFLDYWWLYAVIFAGLTIWLFKE